MEWKIKKTEGIFVEKVIGFTTKKVRS